MLEVQTLRKENYRNKRNFIGNKNALFEQIADTYDLGEVKKYSKVQIGYEDDNNVLETSKGVFFVKIFGAYRDLKECQRYVGLLDKVIAAGVKTPKTIKLNNNSLGIIGGINVAVFEFIAGKTFYELARTPSEDEAKEILMQAAKINQIDFRPAFVYDEWAIVNILDQYRIVEPHLSKEENARISPLIEKYKSQNIDELPHSLVHGDIITSNAIQLSTGIYIIDFACANYYPRIIELAVLACNLLASFDLLFIINEYEKQNQLTNQEKELLPFFVELAHAMHVIGAVRERDIHGNNSKENEYWLNQGLKGLKIHN